MEMSPYRSALAAAAEPSMGRRWGEIDAELLAAVLSLVLVLAGLLGQAGQTGTTLGLLGLLASSYAIVGWLRRGAAR